MEENCEIISKNIILRINKLKGQLEGIGKMVNNKRDSLEIVQQISAIRSALSGLALEVLKKETAECMKKKNKDERIENLEKIVSNLLKNT